LYECFVGVDAYFMGDLCGVAAVAYESRPRIGFDATRGILTDTQAQYL